LDEAPLADTNDLRGGIVKPDSSRLYHVVALGAGGARVLKLDVKGMIRLFSFTFG